MSLLSRQNFYLRLLILFLALVSAIEASLRQVLYQTMLFLFFFLLDPRLFPALIKALRRILPFFTGYWLFAMLFGVSFPNAVLFSARIVFFVIASVYVFANLSWGRIMHDTIWLRKFKSGDRLISFVMATSLFIRNYAKEFGRSQIRSGNSIGAILDSVINSGQQVYGRSDLIAAQMDKAKRQEPGLPAETPANLIALSLMALMAVINSL